jgi:hypothetical protein
VRSRPLRERDLGDDVARGLIDPTKELTTLTNATATPAQIVFWHRELPPLDAEPIGEHTVEANSPHVQDTLAHRNELWEECRLGLVAAATRRIDQEVARLGGRFAHVLDERIQVKRDAVQSDAWMHGRYTYMLYR